MYYPTTLSHLHDISHSRPTTTSTTATTTTTTSTAVPLAALACHSLTGLILSSDWPSAGGHRGAQDPRRDRRLSQPRSAHLLPQCAVAVGETAETALGYDV